MIPGLDSSYARPDAAAAAAARVAGIRVWGGYLASRDGLGLATRWSRADFEVVQAAGLQAIGFCSGWDDPVWIRTTAAAWGIRAAVDVETGIRSDGPWVSGWVTTAASGLYGLASAHYHTGAPVGRGAAFNIVADYLAGGCTGESWPSWLPRPAHCGWQCQGTHDEFGRSVDRLWLDDWFGAPRVPAVLPGGSVQYRPNDPSGRFDDVGVGLDGAVWWLTGSDIKQPLAQVSLGGQALPFSAVCSWSNAGDQLLVRAAGLDGHYYYLLLAPDGHVLWGWTQDVAMVETGMPGPAGPPGPAAQPYDDAALRSAAAAADAKGQRALDRLDAGAKALGA